MSRRVTLLLRELVVPPVARILEARNKGIIIAQVAQTHHPSSYVVTDVDGARIIQE